MDVLFVPLQVFPRYSSTVIWRGTENGETRSSSLLLCARQPDLILLHFSSGFAPLLSASSIHLWAPTHKRMCSETRSYACQALMTIRLNLFEGSNKTTTTTTNKKKICLTAEFIQILFIQILFGNVYRCFF